jgi:hypothetical protein
MEHISETLKRVWIQQLGVNLSQDSANFPEKRRNKSKKHSKKKRKQLNFNEYLQNEELKKKKLDSEKE